MQNFKKKDFDNMQIIQISEDDVELSSTLESEDAGLWCIIINGSYQGFEDTKEDIEKLYKLMQN